MSNIDQSFFEILSALNAHDVRFVVIGGVAMRLHGSAHITDDVDLSYPRDADNLSQLIKALAQFHPRLRDFPPDLPFVFDARTLRAATNLTLDTDLGELDLLAEPAGVDSFDGLWERSEVMEVDGHSVHVCSLEDLIAMKKTANRPKDQIHLMELQALAKIIKEEKSQYSSAPTNPV
jgi:predicted nucleotidyltransferase